MRVVVVTKPESVVSLDDAKLHLRVDDGDSDALITAYVAAATNHLEGPFGWLGRSLGPQTLELQCGLTYCPVWLPLPPFISLVSVKYLDSDQAEQTVDNGEFHLFGSEGNVLTLAGSAFPWSSGSTRPDALRIRYRAGYVEDPAGDPLVPALPEPIKAAILLMTGDLYANRETAVTGTIAAKIPMSTTVENLLASYRVYA